MKIERKDFREIEDMLVSKGSVNCEEAVRTLIDAIRILLGYHNQLIDEVNGLKELVE